MALPKVTKSVNHTTLPAKTPEANTGALPEEVSLLQEEMNKAMGHLLMTRTSLDTHQQKQVSDFEMALCQNEAKVTKAIKEAKAHCGAAIREAEACHSTLIREEEDDCTTIAVEVETCCTTSIRKAEPHCMERSCSIQQLHAEDM